MKVRFGREHRAGDRTFAANTEHDLPDREARAFVAAGHAEEVTAEPATMRLRFRHDYTVAGKAHRAGSTDRVPVSDEAWDAVNLGHADLDPPPGVAGQPFPPEDVRRDETTDAPLPPSPVMVTPSGTARLTGATPSPAPPKRGTAPAKAAATGKTPDVAPEEPSRLDEDPGIAHAPAHMPSAPQATPPPPPHAPGGGGPKRGGR